jgi:hypothetical protein
METIEEQLNTLTEAVEALPERMVMAFSKYEEGKVAEQRRREKSASEQLAKNFPGGAGLQYVPGQPIIYDPSLQTTTGGTAGKSHQNLGITPYISSGGSGIAGSGHFSSAGTLTEIEYQAKVAEMNACMESQKAEIEEQLKELENGSK